MQETEKWPKQNSGYEEFGKIKIKENNKSGLKRREKVSEIMKEYQQKKNLGK